jgi:hypothetical protein
MTKKPKSIGKMVLRPTETCFVPLALSFQNRISGFPYDAPRRSFNECIGDLALVEIEQLLDSRD